MNTLILTAALILTSFSAQAANYKYSELGIKDYDEMNQMVQERVKKARELGNADDEESVDDRQAIEILRDAMKLVLSRPNNDNMVAKLLPEIRRDLSGYSSYEDTLSSVVSEAIDTLKSTRASTSQRATSLFILENGLSEVRPEMLNNADLRRIVERVRDAKIEVPKEVVKELKLGGMWEAHNPSKQASEIIKKDPKAKK